MYRAAGRLQLWRLPAMRRDRALLADNEEYCRLCRGWRPGAGHLQRLSDFVRSPSAARSAYPQSLAVVYLRDRDRQSRELPHAIYVFDATGRFTAATDQAWRRMLRRARGGIAPDGGARASAPALRR